MLVNLFVFVYKTQQVHDNNYADYSWHNKLYVTNKFIDTYPTSLLTPIREFLTFP